MSYNVNHVQAGDRGCIYPPVWIQQTGTPSPSPSLVSFTQTQRQLTVGPKRKHCQWANQCRGRSEYNSLHNECISFKTGQHQRWRRLMQQYCMRWMLYPHYCTIWHTHTLISPLLKTKNISITSVTIMTQHHTLKTSRNNVLHIKIKQLSYCKSMNVSEILDFHVKNHINPFCITEMLLVSM